MFIRDIICVDELRRKENTLIYNTLQGQVKLKFKENSEFGEIEFLADLKEGLISKHIERLFNEKIFDSQVNIYIKNKYLVTLQFWFSLVILFIFQLIDLITASKKRKNDPKMEQILSFLDLGGFRFLIKYFL